MKVLMQLLTLDGPAEHAQREILAKPCCGPRLHGPKHAVNKSKYSMNGGQLHCNLSENLRKTTGIPPRTAFLLSNTAFLLKNKVYTN